METLNGIDIIDCKGISGKPLADIVGTKEFQTFTEQFGNGMKKNGIVYLINHEVEPEVISDFEEKWAEFCALPFDLKKSYQPDAFGLSKYGSWGWKGPTTAKLIETTYTVESFDFTMHPRFEDESLYPKEISGFKQAVVAFRQQTRKLSNKLLRSLGDCLELEDKDYFIHKHRALEENYEKSKFSARALYYPKEPTVIRENAAPFRIPAHQDFGTLTHLYQNSQGGGLQAKLGNGEWVDVEYIPNSFVLTAGRSLEMWTGGNIPAVFHRVAWTEKSNTESRISFGCFLGPDRDSFLGPIVKENPNWTRTYELMKPGEIFDDYYRREVILLEKSLSKK